MSSQESKQDTVVVNKIHQSGAKHADPTHGGISDSAKDRLSSMEITGVTIDVVEVSYSVTVDAKVKRLLKNCSFSLVPGELCALMGPSGAGKSTLLDLVADRKKVGAWHGEVYIDKKPRNRLFPQDIAYVLQDDVHIATLTVEETLLYAAWTRMPEGTSLEVRQQRVNDLLNIMGLSHVRNSLIGDPMKKGISGGQQKRLSIAVEIIHMPSLIFLDEPTSGLDSSIALEVMGAVRELTAQRRTCISTIHQPSPEVYALFDKLVLLSAGRVIYFGPAREAADFFRSTGYYYDGLRNPAEFIIEVSCGQLLPEGEKEARQPEVLEMEFRASKYSSRPSVVALTVADPADIEANNKRIAHMRLHSTNKLTQLKMLVHRTWLSKIRDTDDLKAQFGKNMIVGLLIGILFRTQGNVSTPFYDHGVVDASVTNCSSILFMSMMFTMVGNSQAIPYISGQILIYRRELASNAYGTFPFWLAAVLTNLPIIFAYHFLFILFMYFLVELPSNAHYFFFFLFLTWLGSLVSYYSAMAMAAFINDDELAFVLFPLQFLLFAMFSGYPINMNDIPDYYIWGPYIAYTRYVFEGLMVNQWSQFDDDDLSSGYLQNGNGNILSLYDFTSYEANWSFGIVLGYAAFFASLTYIFLKPKINRLVRVDKPAELMGAASVARGTSLIGRGPSLYGAAKSGIDAVVRGASVGGVNRTKSKGNRGSNDLGVSLVGSSGYGDEDDVIDTDEQLQHEPKLTVDFYRVSTGIVDAAQGCRLVFRNVNYSVTSKADGKTKVKLLTDVTGRANPGEMVALMGASGAGKSTLLDVIAQRKNTGTIMGDITYNGSKVMRSFAYVMQDNVFIGLLTVRETLYYAAELRLSEFMSKEDKVKRVDKLINMLGLSKQADTILGTANIRGISGGQLKRVMIGVEIIQLPDLMFLDEPTTGLDSSIALEVMSAVRNLANQNRTVICTIHQPSPDTFALFDTLLLLAAGRVIYFGAISSMINFFQDSPYKFPYKEGSNPADYVVAVGGGFINASDGSTISGAELADYYTTTDKFQAAQEMFPSSSFGKSSSSAVPGSVAAGAPAAAAVADADDALPFQYNISTMYQLKTLISRRMLLIKKDPPSVIVQLVRNLMVATFYGSIYYDLDTGTDVSDYTNRFSIFFFSLMFFLLKDMQAVPALMADRLIFYRERGAKAYGALTYWISTWLLQLPIVVLSVLLYAAVLYPMVGFRSGQHHFNWFFYFLLMQSLIGVFVGIGIAALAPSSQAGLSLFPILLFWQVGFAGYLVYIPQFDDYLRAWAPYCVWMRYSFQGLVMNEIQHNDDLPNYQLYLNDLGFDNSFSVKGCAGVLPIFLGTAMLLSLMVIKFVDWEER